jgi:hypothetical protein
MTMPDEFDEVEEFPHEGDETIEERDLLVEVEPVEVVRVQLTPNDNPTAVE